MRASASPLMFVMLACCGCAVAGCPQRVTLITFTIDEPEPVEDYTFVPVVMQEGTLRYAPAYTKTPDLPGYNRLGLTLEDPDNLAYGWQTTGVSHYEHVGIVVMKRNAPEGESASPRLYWFSESDRLGSGDRVIHIPKLGTLPLLETPPVQ